MIGVSVERRWESNMVPRSLFSSSSMNRVSITEDWKHSSRRTVMVNNESL